MKNKKKQISFIIKIVALFMLLTIVMLCLNIRLPEGGGVYVGNPIFYDYAYTVYKDYAVLEQFKGVEQEEIVIPIRVWGKPVTTIGWECFQQCNNIKKVVLHEEIEVIEGYAFWGCDNLTEVVGGSNVYQIGTQAFSPCRKLKVVEVGKKLQIIGDGAFWNCESLKTLETQENLVVIEDGAFWNSGLVEFTFTEKAQVGSSAFRDTPWLQNQEEAFLIYGDGQLVWYNGDEKRVVIPEGVATLVKGCFAGTRATEIYIPETVTRIMQYAFEYCEDIKVYIPESVVEMGGDRGQLIVDYNDAITIITTKDSYAHQYAIDHDIPYEIVESW